MLLFALLNYCGRFFVDAVDDPSTNFFCYKNGVTASFVDEVAKIFVDVVDEVKNSRPQLFPAS